MARPSREIRLLVSFAAAAAMAVGTAPSAGADPLTDLLCSVGSAQFCAPAAPPQSPPAPPAPAPQAPAPQAPAPQAPAPQQSAPQQSTFQYRNCDEARAAGAAPVLRGEYGYGRHLDRDNDGIGCERS